MGDSEGRSAAKTGKEECHSDDCKWHAWELRCQGVFAYLPIAKAVNEKFHASHPRCPDGPHNNHWAQRKVEECSQAVGAAIRNGAIDALAELVQGYQKDIAAQNAIATGKSVDANTRSMARKRVSELREKKAAALGIITERKGVDHGGNLNINAIDKLTPETRQRMIADIEASASDDEA